MRPLEVGRHLRHVRPVEVVHVEGGIRRRPLLRFCRFGRLGHVGKDLRCRGVLPLYLKPALLRIEVRLDALAGQVVGEVGGTALAGAALRSPLVHSLVGPSRRDLAGLPVGLRGLLQRHAAQLKIAPELVQRAGAVAGSRHPVAETLVERTGLERLALLLPEGHLLVRPEHRETILTAQLIIDRLHTRSVEARVPLVDDLTGTGVVVRNGRVRMHAASLAVHVHGDPAHGVGGKLVAQRVRVLHATLDVVGLAWVKLVGRP